MCDPMFRESKSKNLQIPKIQGWVEREKRKKWRNDEGREKNKREIGKMKRGWKEP